MCLPCRYSAAGPARLACEVVMARRATKGILRYMAPTEDKIAVCQYAGCGRGRTQYSVFCEEHHREQLERTTPREELPAREVWRQVTGPWWLDCIRGMLAGQTYWFPDRRMATVYWLLAAGAVVWFGWRWAHRLIWLPERGYPVYERPGQRLLVLIGAYSLFVMAACAWIISMMRRMG